MLDDKPLIGHTYIHTQTQNEYTVNELGKLKCPESGYWYDAVFYTRTDGSPGCFSRTVQSFVSNFKDVENIVET